MKFAMLYASWEKFGEKWSTPAGVRSELLSRGHEVRHYNLYHDEGRLLPGRNVRNYSNQGLNILFNEYNSGEFVPDVVFLMDYGPWDAAHFSKQYFPESILVKEAGDEPQAFRLHWPASERVHLILSPDHRCVESYRQNNRNAVWWTHFADERLFFPQADVKEEFDCVTTCGPRGNGLTEEVKEALGDRFNNERYFFDVEYARRLNMGKMVFQHSQYTEVTRRVFEGMACGKMVITDRLPEQTHIQDLFTDGEDIVFYDNAEDAIEKIKYYAEHDAERQRIADNGYNKVRQHHTVKARVDVLEQEINNIKESSLV